MQNTTSMKTQIHTILGKNKLQYLNEVNFQYNIWCEWLSGVVFVPARDLQTNTQLWNWFNEKWTIYIEVTFLNRNQEYINAGVKDVDTYWQLFSDIIEEYGLLGSYPGTLLKKIKTEHYKTLQNNG